MWSNIKSRILWIKKHLFEILAILSFIFILIASIFRLGKKGSWDSYYYYDPYPNFKPLKQQSNVKKDSNGELRARSYLEKRFNKKFPKERPNFMVNQVTGSRFNLELDCYNESLKLAVEFNGAQHYKYIPFFHKNKEAFYNQKYRDELKRIRCKELGITLIEIPYTEENKLENYLENELKIAGFL